MWAVGSQPVPQSSAVQLYLAVQKSNTAGATSCDSGIYVWDITVVGQLQWPLTVADGF